MLFRREASRFNVEATSIRLPHLTGPCPVAAFLQFRCPEEARLFGQPPADFRYFRSNTDCEHYFVCVNGRPRRYHCGEGRAFSEELGRCDAAENVTGW